MGDQGDHCAGEPTGVPGGGAARSDGAGEDAPPQAKVKLPERQKRGIPRHHLNQNLIEWSSVLHRSELASLLT